MEGVLPLSYRLGSFDIAETAGRTVEEAWATVVKAVALEEAPCVAPEELLV